MKTWKVVTGFLWKFCDTFCVCVCVCVILLFSEHHSLPWQQGNLRSWHGHYASDGAVSDDQNDAVDGSGMRAWSASDRDYTYDEVCYQLDLCSHNLNNSTHPCIKSSAKFDESTFYLQCFFEASLSLITTCSS